MDADRLLADDKCLGDLQVGVPARHQGEDLGLARGEAKEGRVDEPASGEI